MNIQSPRSRGSHPAAGGRHLGGALIQSGGARLHRRKPGRRQHWSLIRPGQASSWPCPPLPFVPHLSGQAFTDSSRTLLCT